MNWREELLTIRCLDVPFVKSGMALIKTGRSFSLVFLIFKWKPKLEINDSVKLGVYGSAIVQVISC